MLNSDLSGEQKALLDRLAEAITRLQPAVAFTGAGISTESGIPDYRGPSGLWKRTSPTLYREFIANPDIRLRYWQRRRERYPVLASAQPNAGHLALSRLQESGFLSTIITQNIDGLHQKAGSDDERIIELHGSVHQIRCLDCRRVFPASVYDDAFDGREPSCVVCGGMVKEATISFGEPLVADDLREALAIARTAGVLLVVGSSLAVNPAAKVPLEAVKAGAVLAIVNNEPTPLDDRAELVIRTPAGTSLAYLADAVDGRASP